MNKNYYILTVNPGSTSTKIGIFENEELLSDKNINHNDQDIVSFKKVWDQYAFRKQEILNTLRKEKFDIKKLACVVGRGGLFRPIISGTYKINKQMLNDARQAIQGEHASNLGCVLAYGIAWDYNIPSYIVDPPCVDEMEDVARISGHIAIKRRSLVHALNIKAIARAASATLKKPLSQLNLIVVHIGGGISVTPLRKGRMIDTSEALGSGPFSPERTGTLPMMDYTEYIFKNNLSLEQAKKMLVGQGGMYSYLKTKSLREAEDNYLKNEPKARLIIQAMAYQIAKEIGAMAVTLNGEIDAIAVTGGGARCVPMVDIIKEKILFLVKNIEKNILLFPGEDELKALAQGALRVLRGEEEALVYPQQIDYKELFNGNI
ncbi:MAG: butyrate kinase [Acidobacteria bacterium]|jgi:butyrate kinase|nr:butyrate kinase [Acidobacteriota bacterium]